MHGQLQLQCLNQELETRVAERTKQLEEALAESRRQQQQLADQQELLSHIMEQLPAGIATLSGPEHRYTFLNERYQVLTGHLSQPGQPIAEDFLVSREEFTQVLDQVYATGQPHKDHEVATSFIDLTSGQRVQRYVEINCLPLHNGQNHPTGILIFVVDVTAKVLVRQQAEAVRAIFELAPAAMFVVHGPNHRIDLVNASMGKLLGRQPAQLLGQPCFEAMPELVNQGYLELLEKVWHTGQTHMEREREGHLMSQKPGEAGYFNCVCHPLRNAQGEMIGIACVTVNVTAQVLDRQQVQHLNKELSTINEELRATNQQLVRTNVDLDTFIYTASHDLKAPIANIEGLLRAVQHELPLAGRVGDVPAMLDMMQDAVERFKRTIWHLTEVSRLQKEQDQPLIKVNLARIVREVSLDLAPLIAQTAAQITVEIPANLTLLFAEKNLRSVVYNLLSNALKYCHPSRVPVVRIECQPHGPEYVLRVQDNGLGLDLKKGRSKLFVMFQRLHTHVEGSGVGLYMIKKMVENAGGRIEVQSELGQGTTFSVCLPG